MQVRLKATYFTERQRQGILDTYIYAAKHVHAVPKEGLIQGRRANEMNWTFISPAMTVSLAELEDYGVLGVFTPLTACSGCLDGLEDMTTFTTTTLPAWKDIETNDAVEPETAAEEEV
jgi:hypothetical protein